MDIGNGSFGSCGLGFRPSEDGTCSSTSRRLRSGEFGGPVNALAPLPCSSGHSWAVSSGVARHTVLLRGHCHRGVILPWGCGIQVSQQNIALYWIINWIYFSLWVVLMCTLHYATRLCTCKIVQCSQEKGYCRVAVRQPLNWGLQVLWWSLYEYGLNWPKSRWIRATVQQPFWGVMKSKNRMIILFVLSFRRHNHTQIVGVRRQWAVTLPADFPLGHFSPLHPGFWQRERTQKWQELGHLSDIYVTRLALGFGHLSVWPR